MCHEHRRMLTQTVCDDEIEIRTGNPAGALIWHASTMAAASHHGYLEQVCEIRQGTQTCRTVYVRIQMWTHTCTQTHKQSYNLFLLDFKAGMAARSMYACDIKGK